MNLLTKPLWETSLQELSTRSLDRTYKWQVPLQDLLISWISSRELFTRLLHTTFMRDPCATSPDISLDLLARHLREIPTGTLYKVSWQHFYDSMRDLNYRSSLPDPLTRPLWAISIQDLLISMDLLTKPLWATSLQELPTRSLDRTYKWQVPLQDLLISWISSRELFTRLLHTTFMRDPCATSPDISLDLLARHLREIPTGTFYKVSWQHFYDSMGDLFYRSSLHKTSMRDLYTRCPDIFGPPGKTSMRDLFTGALYKISSQDLFTRPLSKISMRDLCTTLDIEASMKNRYRGSLQDLLTRPLWEICIIQDLLIARGILDLFTGALYKICSQDLNERAV